MLDRNDFISAIENDDERVIADAQHYIKPGVFEHEQLCWLLYYSARRGYLSILQLLINQQLIDVNTRLFDKTSCLIEAVDAGQLTNVKFLLAMGAKQTSHANGQYPIDIAIENNNKKITVALYQQSAESLRIEFNISSPLNAAWRTHRSIFESLYKKIIATGDLKTLSALQHLSLNSFNYEFVMSDSKNAVLVAIENGQLEILKYLVDEKNCVLKPVYDEYHLVLDAIANGHLHILKYLAENKSFSLKVVNAESWGPVQFAAAYGHIDIFEYLVDEKKLNMYLKDRNRTGPDIIAIQNGHLHFLKYLTHKKNYKFNDESVLAAISYGQLDILQYFLKEQKFSLKSKNIARKWPVLLAAESSLDVLKYIVEEEKLSLKVEDSDGYGPIERAVQGGKIDILRYLFDEKHLPIKKSDRGKDLIIIAIQNNRLHVLKYLAEEKNLSFDVKDINGYGPVLIAVGRSLGILKYLVDERGLTLNVINRGDGPIRRAVKCFGYHSLGWLINVKKCPFDPNYLLKCFKGISPAIFQTIFFDMFDAFFPLDQLDGFLSLAETAFASLSNKAIKNKMAMKKLFEEKLQFCRETNHPAYLKFLDVYYSILPVEAFQFETDSLLRENKFEEVISLCDEYLSAENIELQEIARLIKAEQIYLSVNLYEEGSPLNYLVEEVDASIKGAIQAYYLFSNCHSDAACSLRNRLHVELSPKDVARTVVSEDTWCDDAKKYYLLYVVFKQNSNNEHIQKLIENEIQVNKKAESNYGCFFHRGVRPELGADSETNAPTLK